jgi:ribosome-associated protein
MTSSAKKPGNDARGHAEDLHMAELSIHSPERPVHEGSPETVQPDLAGANNEAQPSKTQIKRQMHELRDLGLELVNLGKDQLAQLDLPETLRDAIVEMRNIRKFGAQRRQAQYIGKLMRELDTAPILAKLDQWKGTSRQQVAYVHKIERWRDRLLENDSALTELLSAHPTADVQHLRGLIRNARREHIAGKPPKSYREIFQALKEIMPDA